MKLVFILLFTFNLFGQTVIDVIVRPPEGNMRTFEYKLIEAVFLIYNKRYDEKLKINYIELKEFHDITPRLKQSSSNTSFAMSGFTIYETDLYDFSAAYFIVKNSVIVKKEFTKQLNKATPLRIGYMNSHIYKTNIDSLVSWYNAIPVVIKKYRTMEYQTIENKIDGFIGDSIDGWLNPKLKVLIDIEYNPSYIGLKFKRGSKLKEKLDPIIEYYIKSKAYYTLLRTYFGNDFSKYYRHTSNAMKKK